MAGLRNVRTGKRIFFFPLLGLALAHLMGCAPRARVPLAPVAAPHSTPLPTVVLRADGTPPPVSPIWTDAQQLEILAKTRELKLTPELSALSDGERACIGKLAEVGAIMQSIYERSRHRDAAAIREHLENSGSTPALKSLFRLFSGPIATTLDNKRTPFIGSTPEVAGKHFYPWGIKKDELDAYLQTKPEERGSILGVRTIVRRADRKSLGRDLATLSRFPVLETLHPGLRRRLEARSAAPGGFYAVPYALAYANDLVRAHALLHEAADLVQGSDSEFASYLRNRGRDLLASDYEAGDASWVTGRFKNLNAQIGSYETYADQLYGVKAAASLSILAKDVPATEKLSAAIKDLQGLEDSLPYRHQKQVRSDISLGIYNVVADFGQARGTNTATILPNDPLFSRKYGRTILLRANVMRNPELFVGTKARFAAAVDERMAGDLTIDGGFYRTLWHEIGHYLGVDKTADGRTLDIALQENASTFEEMKADLVSLFAVRELERQGYYTPVLAKSVYASGIRRVLQVAKPRPTQPYQTMQLMQLNYFLENGLLTFDEQTQRLAIQYHRYHDVVTQLLRVVLEIQRSGDKAESDAFIERYATWKEELHGALATKIRQAQKYRFTLVYYPTIE